MSASSGFSRTLLFRQLSRKRWLHSAPSISVPDLVQIVEVGPRDGLQNEPSMVSTRDKVTLITKLAEAGCSYIEAGSFVSPKAVPAMANSLEVMQELSQPTWRNRHDNITLSCLVPTKRYFQNAIDVQADEIAIFGAASQSFSQKNIRSSIEESMDRFRSVTDAAKSQGIPIRGYLSCVIACPYEGSISPTQVAKVCEFLLDLGCREISLGDTIGAGTPASTVEMLNAVFQIVDPDKLAVHFHDTYGQALANILVSLERGIRTVDSSVAGLGGCPYAKGATGNVASEDVVYMLHGLGVTTGINLDKLVDAGTFICNTLSRPSNSRAGTAIAAKRRNTFK